MGGVGGWVGWWDIHTLFRVAAFAVILRHVIPLARVVKTAEAGGISTITACACLLPAGPVLLMSFAAPKPLMLFTLPRQTADASSIGLSVYQVMVDFLFGPCFQSRKMCLRHDCFTRVRSL